MMWNRHNWCLAPISSIIWGYALYPSVIIVSNGNPSNEVIKNDFATNGETHYNYILEKLSKAQWDLNVLIKMAENKKEEVEKKEE